MNLNPLKHQLLRMNVEDAPVRIRMREAARPFATKILTKLQFPVEDTVEYIYLWIADEIK
jgi:hypothetical protein